MTLLQCLNHLERQTCMDFQVLIIDDGSTDDTHSQVERYKRSAPFPITYLHQVHSGAAKARNRAIAELTSTICTTIGDDIFPAPEFVSTHLRFHQTHPQLSAVAVGHTRWSERGQTVTPLMRWLASEGVQFAYRELLEGGVPSWKHFYTSNLSAKTDYLRQNPFHEGFAKCGLEDIELGYRLAVEHELTMFFLPEAVADHLHPTTFLQTCNRAIDTGGAAYVFEELWPEHRPPRKSALKKLLLFILTEPRFVLPALSRITEMLTHLWCPNPLLPRVLQFHSLLGHDRAAGHASAGPSSPYPEVD